MISKWHRNKLVSKQRRFTQCMLDTFVTKRLADLTAQHTHGDISAPDNSAAISKVGSDAITSNNKYSSIIAK